MHGERRRHTDLAHGSDRIHHRSHAVQHARDDGQRRVQLAERARGGGDGHASVGAVWHDADGGDGDLSVGGDLGRDHSDAGQRRGRGRDWHGELRRLGGVHEQKGPAHAVGLDHTQVAALLLAALHRERRVGLRLDAEGRYALRGQRLSAPLELHRAVVVVLAEGTLRLLASLIDGDAHAAALGLQDQVRVRPLLARLRHAEAARHLQAERGEGRARGVARDQGEQGIGNRLRRRTSDSSGETVDAQAPGKGGRHLEGVGLVGDVHGCERVVHNEGSQENHLVPNHLPTEDDAHVGRRAERVHGDVNRGAQRRLPRRARDDVLLLVLVGRRHARDVPAVAVHVQTVRQGRRREVAAARVGDYAMRLVDSDLLALEEIHLLVVVDQLRGWHEEEARLGHHFPVPCGRAPLQHDRVVSLQRGVVDLDVVVARRRHGNHHLFGGVVVAVGLLLRRPQVDLQCVL